MECTERLWIYQGNLKSCIWFYRLICLQKLGYNTALPIRISQILFDVFQTHDRLYVIDLRKGANFIPTCLSIYKHCLRELVKSCLTSIKKF